MATHDGQPPTNDTAIFAIGNAAFGVIGERTTGDAALATESAALAREYADCRRHPQASARRRTHRP